MSRVFLELPVPPSVNEWKVPLAKGRAVLSEPARIWKAAAAELAKKRCSRRLTAPLHVRIDVYRPRNAGDWDGYGKLACDALEGVVYANDSEIRGATVRTHKDAECPRIEVTVTEVAEPMRPKRDVSLSPAEQSIFDTCVAELAGLRAKKREREKAKDEPRPGRLPMRVMGESVDAYAKRVGKPASYRSSR